MDFEYDQIREQTDRIKSRWESGEPNEDLGTALTYVEHLLERTKQATIAIVKMAQETAKDMYGIESDKQYWRLCLPEEAQRALGWKLHEYHEPGDHECEDDTTCYLCNLAVCKVCGLFEGGLTTECPGKIAPQEYAEQVYNGRMDFRHGKWVVEYGPHRQSTEWHADWKRARYKGRNR